MGNLAMFDPIELDDKELYRRNFNTPLRGDVQVNAGRVQQAGKEAYSIWYASNSLNYRNTSRHNWSSSLKTLYHLTSSSLFGRLNDRLGYIYSIAHLLNKIEKKKKNNFVELANILAEAGWVDAALDMVYDRIDALLTEGNFEEIDSMLRGVDLKRLSVDILLGLLTSTLPAKTKLRFRKDFFSAVEEEIKWRREWENGLLTGLES